MATVETILERKGTSVVGIKASDTLSHALLMLAEHKIGALLVLDEKGSIRGILSERDIVRHFARKTEHQTTKVLVQDVMTRGVTYVKKHQGLEECLTLMTSGRFRHLPVVEDEKVVGIISIGDVVKAVLEDREAQIGQLEHYITSDF